MEKTAIRFEPELKAEIQNMMGEANATSMADFVRQATEFYIAYLRQKKSIGCVLFKGQITLPLPGLYHSMTKVVVVNLIKMGTLCFGEYHTDGNTDAYPIS